MLLIVSLARSQRQREGKTNKFNWKKFKKLFAKSEKNAKYQSRFFSRLNNAERVNLL